MSEEKKRTRGRPKSAQTVSRAKKAKLVPPDQVVEIFNYWLEVMRSGSKRVPKLDDKRYEYIGAAIYDYGMEDCRAAIDGCTKSDFHMGRNKQGIKYDSIELIFRDSEHIDRFIGYFDRASQDQGDPF